MTENDLKHDQAMVIACTSRLIELLDKYGNAGGADLIYQMGEKLHERINAKYEVEKDE